MEQKKQKQDEKDHDVVGCLKQVLKNISDVI